MRTGYENSAVCTVGRALRCTAKLNGIRAFHVAYTGFGRAYACVSNPQEMTMKRMMLVLMLASFSAMLAGCNTMAGAGKDVQKVGEKVEDKAEDCKDAKC